MSSPTPFEQLRQKLPKLRIVHDKTLVAPNILTAIHALSDEVLFGGPIKNADMSQAARAGLILEAGGWDEAHSIVQAMSTPEAEYWHAILHRREPDASNAKYWFRQVGDHPVMGQLLSRLRAPGGPDPTIVQRFVKEEKWDPAQYVTLCTTYQEDGGRELLPILLDIQDQEITGLLNYCVQHALGRSSKKA